MLALQVLQRFAQVGGRDVHGHVALHLESIEQARGLFAIAGAEVDQRRHRAERQRHGRQLLAENRRLGAGRVILGQLGDGSEQPRAERIVEVFGRHARRPRAQPGQQFPADRGRVVAGDLDQLRRLHATVSSEITGSGDAVPIAGSWCAYGAGQPRMRLASSQRARSSCASRPPRWRMP
jgi:hypothetical protein